MLRGITHNVSSRIAACELTHLARQPIDFDLASRQHHAYEDKLRAAGVAVTSLSGNDDFPDASFVEDTAIVLDQVAIICSMGVASRRGETALIARELSKYRALDHISLPATIEGGDVLIVGRRILVGLSARTNNRGISELARIAAAHGYNVTSVAIKNSLHLKSVCTAIDDETLFLNPEFVDTRSIQNFRILATAETEPQSANVLRFGSKVFVQAGFPRAAEIIGRINTNVETLDMSELRKAEAGLTCCSILFDEI